MSAPAHWYFLPPRERTKTSPCRTGVFAYNGGPGNLKKWKEETNYLDDPLFFMESIPSRETRWFIEKILTKYWIYQNKNKKNMTTLKMLANGKDPLY